MKQQQKRYGGQHTVEAADVKHTFDLYTSRRVTITLRMRRDGHITVDAPHNTPLKFILDFVASRSAWISKHKAKIQQREVIQPEREYINGEKWHFLGRAYTLQIRNNSPESVTLTGGDIIATVSNITRTPQVMRQWYMRHARQIFIERTASLKAVFAPLGITPPDSITIREMVSRWGSCTGKGRVTLNLKLVQLSPHLIDYVIAHELCHLREMNHGPRFYELLEKVMPDWREKRRTLNTIPIKF